MTRREDPTVVVAFRLDGFAPIPPGPLPWVSDIPGRLTDSEWGSYLADRYARVSELASAVRAEPTDEAPVWLPPGTRLTTGLRGDIDVWRAVHDVPAADRRPTGPPHTDLTVADHQQQLDRRVSSQLDRQANAWLGPIIDIVGRRDQRTTALAERLAELTDQGHDTRGLLIAAARGHLPDDHPTAALESRLTRLIAQEKQAAETRRQMRDSATRHSNRGPGTPGIGR